MIKFFLSRVLAWAASLSWADFLRIVEAAANAGHAWEKVAGMTKAEEASINAARAGHVSGFIQTVFPKLPTRAVNLVREIAVAWLNRSKK